MDNVQKLNAINKIIREIEDISNSSTSVLKKIGQVEAENINLGNKIIEQKIPEIYEHMDGVLTETNNLLTEITEFRDTFVTENKLNEGSEPTA
jgi:division protein CdvB (Snf7/Vps24/ESCRT-III family)